MGDITANRSKLLLFFRIYCVILLLLLFGRFPEEIESTYREQIMGRINLEPLESIRVYLLLLKRRAEGALFRYAAFNLFGNLLLLLPMGCFLPSLWKWFRKLHRVVLVFLPVLCAVECLQLVLRLGSFDVDDILLNILGLILGYEIYLIRRPKSENLK